MALSYKNDNDADERLNPASQEAKSIHDQEQQAAYDRDFNDTVNNNESLSDLRDKEETGGWKTNVGADTPQSGGGKNKITGFFNSNKKKGALAGVIGGTGLVGMLFTLFGPMSMIISLTENLLDTNDGAQSAFQRRITKVLGLKMSGHDAICDNATRNVKCKMGRMTTKGFQKIANKGVVAYDADGNDLSKAKGKYPDKSVAYYKVDGVEKDIPAKDIKKHLADNPKLAAKLLGRSGAFNVRFDVWRGAHMKKQFYDRWSIKRDGGLANGESKNTKVADVMEKLKSKVPGIDGLRDKAKTKISAKTDKMVDRGRKGGMAYLTAVGGCVAVKAPNIIAGGVAAVQAARLMPLSNEVITSPGSITKASYISNPSPEAIEGPLNIVTATDGNNKSATDSAILQSAIGVNTNKVGISEDFAPGYSLLNNPQLQAIRSIDEKSEKACNVVLSPQAMYTAAVANSILTVAASSTLIGGVVKVGAEWAVGAAVAYVAGKAIDEAAGAAIDELAKNDELDKVLAGQPGEKLGDALGVSAMIFFSSGAASRHVPVLKKSQLVAYNEIKNEEREFERQMDLATLSPFDISSKYTFLGSIVHNVNTASIASGSIAHPVSGALTQFAIAPLKLFTPTSFASNQSTSENYCGYAKEFGMEGEENTTPGVNAAGLPCHGYVGNMETIDAVNVALGSNEENEPWIKEEVDEEAPLEEVVEKDSRLSNYLEGCGAASIDNGEWTETAAGCTIETVPSTSSKVDSKDKRCSEGDDPKETGCYSGDAGETKVKASTARESEAVAAFAMDYQISQNIDGYDEEPVTTSIGSGDGTLNAMTWNVLAYESAIKKGLTKDVSNKKRGEMQVEVIKNKSPDIIMFQELKGDHTADLRAGLPEYSSTLQKSQKGSSSKDDGRSVFWKKDVFEEVDRGYYQAWHNSEYPINHKTNRMVWVKLKQLNTGGEVFVFTTHENAANNPKPGEYDESISYHKKEIQDITGNSNASVIFGGHLQSVSPGYATNKRGVRMHTMLTGLGFTDTLISAEKRKHDNCDTAHESLSKQDCRSGKASVIDNIYVKGASKPTVATWENVVKFPEGASLKESLTTQASDANPVITNITIPGLMPSGAESISSQVNTAGYAFPVDLSGLTGGIETNQSKTIHHGGGKYKAFDLMAKDNTSIFAIHKGTIAKVNKSYRFLGSGAPGKACQSITLKADDGYYYWYGHIKGTSVNQGDEVKAGQKIAEVAGRDQYSAACFGGGPHLHIDRDKSWSNIGGGGNGGDPSFIPFLSKLYEESKGSSR